MAKVEDSQIERGLKNSVREAVKNGEDVTVKRVRKRTEEKLGLEDGLLKSEAWREKSKAIIEAAFEAPEEDAKPPAKKAEESAPEPRKKKNRNGDEHINSASIQNEHTISPKPKPPQAAAPQVNGVKRKAADVESTPGSGSDGSASSTSNTGKRSPNKKAKVDAPADPKENDARSEEEGSGSGSEESSETSSGRENESESSEEDNKEEELVEGIPSPSKAGIATHEQSLRAIPAKTFKPPSGYLPMDSAVFVENGALSGSNLDGKQIWHITAPSNVPLSSLTELALSSIQSGEPVLSHKNVQYVLNEDKTIGIESTSLLTPSTQGYRKAQNRISRTLRLQQKINLPNLSALQANPAAGSNAAGDVAQASVSTVRPQPKGLRMRYKPPGFGKGRPGRIGSESESGDGEDGEGGPSFQFPKTLGQHGVEVRQDGDVEMIDAADAGISAGQGGRIETKAKKKRKGKDDGKTDGETPTVNGVSKSGNETGNVLPAQDAALLNGGAEKESKEEKRRRKEEKRARKEAKAKAKEAAV